MKERSYLRLRALRHGFFAVFLLGAAAFAPSANVDTDLRLVLAGMGLLMGLAALWFERKYRRMAARDPRVVGHDVAVRFTRPGSRRLALVVLVVVLVAAGVEAHSILTAGRFHFTALLVLPLALLLSIGGLFDPRILVGVRGDVPGIPPEIRRVSYILGFAGLAISAVLLYLSGFWRR